MARRAHDVEIVEIPAARDWAEISKDWKVVAFAGSRGLVKPNYPAQMGRIDRCFEWLNGQGVEVLLHGGCIGADMIAHRFALRHGWHVDVYPSTLEGTWGEYWPGFTTRTPQPPKTRNTDMVRRCDLVVAAPGPGSRGTWHTVTMAQRLAVPTFVIWPNGLVTYREQVDR